MDKIIEREFVGEVGYIYKTFSWRSELCPLVFWFKQNMPSCKIGQEISHCLKYCIWVSVGPKISSFKTLLLQFLQKS
jgi:hypothetical protein